MFSCLKIVIQEYVLHACILKRINKMYVLSKMMITDWNGDIDFAYANELWLWCNIY